MIDGEESSAEDITLLLWSNKKNEPCEFNRLGKDRRMDGVGNLK